jgi:hypothetical protein
MVTDDEMMVFVTAPLVQTRDFLAQEAANST